MQGLAIIVQRQLFRLLQPMTEFLAEQTRVPVVTKRPAHLVAAQNPAQGGVPVNRFLEVLKRRVILVGQEYCAVIPELVENSMESGTSRVITLGPAFGLQHQ